MIFPISLISQSEKQMLDRTSKCGNIFITLWNLVRDECEIKKN